VAHISENKDIHIPEHLYIQIITELLQFHHKMLSLKFKSAEITARVGSQQYEEQIYLAYSVATEKYIMNLISRAGQAIPRPELEDLIALADKTPMYKVRVQLQEIQRDMS